MEKNLYKVQGDIENYKSKVRKMHKMEAQDLYIAREKGVKFASDESFISSGASAESLGGSSHQNSKHSKSSHR